MSKIAGWVCPIITNNKPIPCADIFNQSDYHEAKDGLINSAIYHCLGRSFNSDDAYSFRFDIFTTTEKEVIDVYYKDTHKASITIWYGALVSLNINLL